MASFVSSSALFFVLLLSIDVVRSSAAAAAAEFKSNSIRAFSEQDAANQQRRPPCVDRSPEARQRDADVVLSGTVQELEADHAVRHTGGNVVSTWRARVRVKRIIKGESLVADILRRQRSRRSDDAQSPSTSGSSEEDVWIGGLGDWRICKSNVRVHDTRIFLTKVVDGELRLNSSIVRVTMDNFDMADAIVQNKPFVPAQPNFVDPCSKVFCPFWAVCVVPTDTGRPLCRCPDQCTYAFAPVCGTDNVTYSNECHMQVASCQQQKRITVAHPGSCGVPDPCRTKKCSHGARCVPFLDGHVARCICPDSCHSYGDSLSPSPVCSVDGVDYVNECELRKAECREMRVIKIKYRGKCDPCQGFPCSQQVCQLDSKRQPVCRCGAHLCSGSEYAPVCATDGRTYTSECLVASEACRSRNDIQVLFRGDCASSPARNPCNRLQCRGPYETCRVSAGRAQCVCPADETPCDDVMKPVCSSDGRTYENECEMKQRSCKTRQTLTVRALGQCKTDGPCSNFPCASSAVCVVLNNTATCVCPTCSDEFQPVCGTNGVTYVNECKLKAENCETSGTVQIAYQGACTSCDKKKCDFYSICEDDGRGGARCVCPSGCTKVSKPVCGTDGETYVNECEMKLASCRKKQFVLLQSEGSCEACADVTCLYGARCENGQCVCPPMNCPASPSAGDGTSSGVCASDGKTYPNECTVRQRSCMLRKEISVVDCDEISGSGDLCDETNCKYGGICKFEASGFTGCTCNFTCDAVRSEVCGSDGKLYGSECLLKQESCQRQVEITLQDLDNCEAIVEELCDGKPPLVKNTTGEEYDCDVGRDHCPAESYCHKTSAGARCCPQDTPVTGCQDSMYGCCQDGVTAAPGRNKAGCPNFCQCNPLGSLSKTCDPVSRQCVCKPGVGGLRCDRCEPGYWGLHKIDNVVSGCTPCGCYPFGSVRDDCEQMTGRCMCKEGVTGQKCSMCSNGNVLTASGSCEDDARTGIKTCADVECRSGSHCLIVTPGVPECRCNNTGCPTDGSEESVVCGTDGLSYGSKCQLKLISCRLNTNTDVARSGPCDKDFDEIRDRKTTPRLRGAIGDKCNTDDECRVPKAICLDTFCVCDDDYMVSNSGDTCIAKPATRPPPATIRLATTKKPTKRITTTAMSTLPPTTTRATTTPPTTLKTTASTKPTTTTTTTTTTPTTTTTTTTTTAPPTTTTTTATTTTTTTTTTAPPTTTRTTVTTLPTPTTTTTTTKATVKTTTAEIPATTTVDMTQIKVPQFTGDSSLELPIKKVVGKTFNYELWMLASQPNGVILYASQSGGATGDFLSLNLVKGYLQLRFNLGTGSANITSVNKLTLGTWHRVIISRVDKSGSLQIDDELPVSGESKGAAKELNLQMKLYVGRYAGVYNPSAGITTGFVGALQRINESGIVIDNLVQSAKNLYGLVEYRGPPCYTSSGAQVCHNGGQCTARLNQFECTCVEPFVGKTCASSSTAPVDINAPVSFTGQSYQSYFNAITKKELSQKTNQYVLRFSTTSESGVLLIQSKGQTVRDDYLVIAVVRGHVEAGYNLGKQGPSNLFSVRSTVYVSDGEWHTVVFTRNLVRAELFVDEEDVVTGSSAAGTNDLNVDGMLWIGGKPNMPTGLPQAYNNGFSGCVESVKIGEKGLHLYNDRKNTDTPILFCDLP